MSTYEEKQKNNEKQKRHYWKHRVRLRHEYQNKRAQADAWKAPTSGRWSIDVIDGEPVITASGGLVSGLTMEAAGRIAAALRKLLGVKGEPKKGSPVWLVTSNGEGKLFCSLTEAGKAAGVHRSTIQRNMLGGGDCAGCGGWTDRADYTGSQVRVGGSYCTILRGCRCSINT